ncbi:MAG: hypothetical protein VX252_00550 [Myxococcota bacterium]|nr:hypothetical protein [Myxococcota bacterium]
MAAQAGIENRWLWGPSRDLLFGCGVWYILFFVFLVFAGPSLRALQPLYLAPFLILLIATPHYGATLLRVYEHREERKAYAFFTVWTTVALIGLFIWGVQDAAIGTLLFTAYLTWSPWHYTGQNYGISVMFMRRRGFEAERAKRWLYTSFILSYALTFLVMHQEAETPRGLAEGGVHLARLGIPKWFSSVAIPATAAVWAGALLATVVLIRKHGRLRDLLPVGLLALSQALWFTLPDLARYFGDTGLSVEALDFDYRAFYFNWIVVAHALQYLWITSYYAKAEERRSGGSGRYFGKTLLAGNVAWIAPALFFAPQLLGGAVSELTVALLVASLVNLHHFILDGAIWKLRDSRVANLLIRNKARTPSPTPAPVHAGSAWRPARFFWIGATALLFVALIEFAGLQIITPAWLEKNHTHRVESLLDTLAWVGRDSATTRTQLGHTLASQGKNTAALRAFRRSHELTPEAGTLAEVARLEFQLGFTDAATASIDKAAELAPHRADVLRLAGEIQLATGHPENAKAYFQRTLKLNPNSPLAAEGLRQIRRRTEP